MTLDNWDDLKFVLAMTRHGTMSAAARYLDTNVATVSRRLDRLSHDLGVSLFEKRGTGFVATKAAEDLALIAEDLDHRLRSEMAAMKIGDAGALIPIEIAAPPAVHKQFVLPRTGELSDYLPHVLLTLTDKVFSQGLGEADIQVRIGRPEGGRLKARKFCDYSLRVYHGRHHKPEGDWIGLTHRYPDADKLREIYTDAKPKPRYRVEEMPMALDMVCETGLPGLLPDFMVQPHHNLVLADLPDNALKGELWITYHETRHSDKTLRSVVDWFCNGTVLSGMRLASE
ncbi:LysR family transcriptional regulator [Jannaschia donghaensis]|uniref:DNA-binding transcriptional activator GcvA n=1 Tax=Jannaschia donghaensis TaxID=420998 RepID=A0A0M6YMS8_9RHOB|nr:LysR family transcriptional regulator [Jannaschia donghaensis]CTQ50557.1 DNA-binding transcriptional activator GcvA [Jannaschia donghaensis]